MRKNCGGPAIAAVAHGTTLPENCFQNRNGNNAKTAKKIKYQIKTRSNGCFGFVGSKRLKCHAHSSALTQARPTAGIQSSENSFVTPSNKTTSKSARPKTGDGFISGSRSVAMMSSKKGSTTEQAGKIAAKSSGASMLLLNLIPVFSASGWNSFTSQMLTAAKKTTNAPSRKNEADRPVRSEGILKMSSPVAASVSNSTASTGNNVAVSTASAMATTSTSKMNGQTKIGRASCRERV